MTPKDEPHLPRTESEFRAERLGFALRSLARELVDERRKVAVLRREVAELRSRLESQQPMRARDENRPGGAGGRPGSRDSRPRDARRSDLATAFKGEAL